MSDTAELVTIGITCFNAADTIERALESAVKQDWATVKLYWLMIAPQMTRYKLRIFLLITTAK